MVYTPYFIGYPNRNFREMVNLFDNIGSTGNCYAAPVMVSETSWRFSSKHRTCL